ncbi:MAG: hypothetical protein U1F16_16260 [Turneriella sp.]
MRYLLYPVLCAAVLAVPRCGSLVNELDRIRLKAEAGVVPNVTHTVPADGTFSAPVQSFADVVFDREIDGGSVTTNAITGACTGTVMVSFDDFATCLSVVASTSGETVRLSSISGSVDGVPLGVTLKIRVSGVRGMTGVTANFYESVKGISFASLCGQNCFYSASAPMSGAIVGGSHSFVIPSGSKAGHIVTFTGVSNATTYYDPYTRQTSAGTGVQQACCGIAGGSHSFEVKTLGGANSGKIITICGGGSTGTCVFDPNTNSFSAGPTGLTGGLPNTGSMTIPVITGGNAGKYLLIAGGSNASYLYDVTANSFTLNGTALIGASSVGAGSHWIRLDNGKPLIVKGGGTALTNTYDEASGIFSASQPALTNVTNGAFSFRGNAGAYSGSIILAHGGASSSSAFDQTNPMTGGPALPCSPGGGALAETLASGLRAGQTMVICGSLSAGYAFYDHGANTFSTLRSLSGGVSSNSSIVKLTTGPDAGKYFIVNGNATGLTSMYDPDKDVTVGTRLFRTTGAGINAFGIKSGLKIGRGLIMTGGSMATSLYNPFTGLMEYGPDLPGAVSQGSLNLPITAGPEAGKQLIFQGGGTATLYVYDPAVNLFANAISGTHYSGTPAAKNTGSRHFVIGSGPMQNSYLILNGGGTATSEYFDPTTSAFSVGPGVVGCASGVQAGSWIFRVGSKFMLLCGSSTNRTNFDPTSLTFSGGSTIGATPMAGAHGFYIGSGTNAGKYLLIVSGNSSVTRLYDPLTDSWGAGPAALCGNAGAGGFAIPVNSGVNAGKILIVLGGGSTATCYFDPAASASPFTPGPFTGSHSGYAVGSESLAFPVNIGLYPNSYLIIHGGTSTVFGHWFAY